jgi:hypothetical protein
MSILPEANRCPTCGLTLVEHAELRAAIPRKAQQSRLLEALRQFVPRYQTHNDALQESLSKSRVGGRHHGAQRFNGE